MNKYLLQNRSIDIADCSVVKSKMYLLSSYNTVTAAASTDFYLKTGATDTHAKVRVVVDGASKLTVYENITLTAALAAGTLSIYNMDRRSLNTCAAVAFRCTDTAWSTKSEVVIFSDSMPGGNKYDSRLGDGNFITLKQSTQYIFRVSNVSAATVTAYLNVEFFEDDLD